MLRGPFELFKVRHWLPSEKRAEKEKSEGTKITVNRTAVVFHTAEFCCHRSIVKGESLYPIIKHKKSFPDGEMIKEAFLEAADSLFQDFRNKPEISSSVGQALPQTFLKHAAPHLNNIFIMWCNYHKIITQLFNCNCKRWSEDCTRKDLKRAKEQQRTDHMTMRHITGEHKRQWETSKTK